MNLHYAVGCVLRTPVKNITIQNISCISRGYKKGLLGNPSIIHNDTQNCLPLVLTTARLLQTTTASSIVDMSILYPSVDVQAMDVSSLIGIITTSNQFQAYAEPNTPVPNQSTQDISVGRVVGIVFAVIAMTIIATSFVMFFVGKLTNKTSVLTTVQNPSYRKKNAFVPIRV
jgi:endoglucanase Acf2